MTVDANQLERQLSLINQLIKTIAHNITRTVIRQTQTYKKAGNSGTLIPFHPELNQLVIHAGGLNALVVSAHPEYSAARIKQNIPIVFVDFG